MNNQITLVEITTLNEYVLRAEVAFGKASWIIELDNDTTVSHIQHSPCVPRDTVVSALDMIGQTLDENCLDAVLCAKRDEYMKQVEAEQEAKRKAEKAEAAKKQEDLKKKLAILFPLYSVDVKSSMSFTITSGPASIRVEFSPYNASGKWCMDETTRVRNQWTGRIETKGVKLTAATLDKLAPRLRNHMDYKVARAIQVAQASKTEAAYDAEMLTLGFTPCGQDAHTPAGFVKTSEGGTCYTDGTRTIRIKRATRADETDVVTAVTFINQTIPLSSIACLGLVK